MSTVHIGDLVKPGRESYDCNKRNGRDCWGDRCFNHRYHRCHEDVYGLVIDRHIDGNFDDFALVHWNVEMEWGIESEGPMVTWVLDPDRELIIVERV